MNVLLDAIAVSSTFAFFEEIASVLAGEVSETMVAKKLADFGFKNVPGIGYAIGLLQILLSSNDADEWNQFVKAAKEEDGRFCGVIIYRYYSFDFEYREDTIFINQKEYVEYESWTGDNFRDVRDLPTSVKSGKWTYNFK